MDLKAYSFIWLSVSDYPSSSPQITGVFVYKVQVFFAIVPYRQP